MTIRRLLLLGLFLPASAAHSQVKPAPYRTIVTGVPYTARIVTTTYATVNGKTVEHPHEELTARNAEGSQWYRNIVVYNDPLTRKDRHDTWNFIWDAAQHTRTDWCVCKTTAYRKQFGEPGPERPRPDLLPGGMDLPTPNDRTHAHIDPLGTRTIQGVEAIGTLTTRTAKTPDGRDLVTTFESWYAPSLHIVLLTLTDDAIRGKSKYELLDLKLVPPDPTLFQLPANYKVEPTHEVEQFQ